MKQKSPNSNSKKTIYFISLIFAILFLVFSGSLIMLWKNYAMQKNNNQFQSELTNFIKQSGEMKNKIIEYEMKKPEN